MSLNKLFPACISSFCLTFILLPAQGQLNLSNMALLYVLLVVVIGSHYGRLAAVLNAILNAVLYAHVFVPPLFSLAITEVQHLLSALIMLVVAILVGHLTASLKVQAEQIQVREIQARTLYDLAKHLTGTKTPFEVEKVADQFLGLTLGILKIKIVSCHETKANFPVSLEALESIKKTQKPVIQIDKRIALLPLTSDYFLLCELSSNFDLHNSSPELLETVASVIRVALDRIYFAEIARETEIRRSAESLRNSILSALSHDLRTPLTVVLGLTESLALGKASPERQKAMLTSLHNQALSINRLVTNLLDMARLRSGQIELNEEWQPIDEVIGATLRQIRSQWRNSEITLDIPPDLPPLRFDAVLIERVLWNLLENAIKYSMCDLPIELIVRRTGDNLDVMICDSGPGLPAEGIEELFGVFQRGQTESNIPGVGLGLAIARTIAEAHGGQVTAENRTGGGACFRLRLPLGNPPMLSELEDDV